MGGKIRNNPYRYEGREVKIYEDNNSDEISLVEIWLLQVRHPEELQRSIRMHKCISERNFLWINMQKWGVYGDNYVFEVDWMLRYFETVLGNLNMWNSGI